MSASSSLSRLQAVTLYETMSTRLGHTRYRVWVVPGDKIGTFDGGWRERILTLGAEYPHRWIDRDDAQGLTQEEARAQRERWIEQSLSLHAEEVGRPAAPTSIDQTVKTTKVKAKKKAKSGSKR